MDFGYRADEIMWLTECGILTLSYQSTSYLTHRVPELGFVDLLTSALVRCAMRGFPPSLSSCACS